MEQMTSSEHDDWIDTVVDPPRSMATKKLQEWPFGTNRSEHDNWIDTIVDPPRGHRVGQHKIERSTD